MKKLSMSLVVTAVGEGQQCIRAMAEDDSHPADAGKWLAMSL